MNYPSSRQAAEVVLAEMKRWLRLSPRTYTASVQLFALRMPAEKLIEALWVAQSKKPTGGLPAFRYFCGVCHTMQRDLQGQLRRN